MYSGQLTLVKRVMAGTSLLVVGGLVAACGKDKKNTTEPNATSIAEFLTAVTGPQGATVTTQTGAAPAAGGGAAVTATAAAALITGGSTPVTLTSTEEFTRAVVAVAGATGYYDITLPAPVTQTTVTVTVAPTLPNPFMTVRYGVGDQSAVGPYAEQPVTVRQVGTGDVQVSVAWDALSDVDLHVVDPNGDEVYYGNDEVPSGGVLDLDSNAACSIDNPVVNQENITWPTGQAPRGTYTVRLDYFDDCDVTRTNYTVTVRVTGQAPQTFSGFFEGEGDGGGEGDGRPITTFTF